ncbi:MAG: Fe-S cluster assembly ATPase SufC [Candidatus Micrarchaeota archaeon]
MVLNITNFHVFTNQKEIIKGIDLTLEQGQIHAFMGPNGSGKSTLCNALMGDPSLETSGSIEFEGKEIIKLKADARAKNGFFLAFQNPEEIEGVKISSLLRKANKNKQNLDKMVEDHTKLVKTSKNVGLGEKFISRELNVGFSGGEKKRMEIVQMLSLNPKVVILDEIDSGLDVDGIKIIAKAIKKMNDGKRIFLIVTHYPRILKYIRPNNVHVLAGGKIVKSGNAKLADEIEKKGYSSYLGDEND